MTWPATVALPRFVPQLDGSPLAGDSCTFVAVAHEVRAASGNRLRPTPTECRRRAGLPLLGASPASPNAANTADAKRSFDSFRRDAAAIDLRWRDFDRRLSAPWEDILDALRDGRGCHLAIDYAALNDSTRGDLSGDPRFRGKHAVFLARLREDPRRTILVYDGLADGRRAGIPKGAQWWPAWLLREVAGAFAGEGRATVGIVRPAQRVAKPKPEPDPEGTCAERLSDARAALRDCRDSLAAASVVEEVLEERIARMEAALGTARQALVDASGGIADALEDIDEALGDAVADPDAGSGAGQGGES